MNIVQIPGESHVITVHPKPLLSALAAHWSHLESF